jgi:hypothetical protein
VTESTEFLESGHGREEIGHFVGRTYEGKMPGKAEGLRVQGFWGGCLYILVGRKK